MKSLALSVSMTVMGLVLVVAMDQPTEDDKPAGPRWFKIVLGADQKPARWHGGVTVTDGRLLEMAPWCLEARDKLLPESRSWQIQTGIPDGRRVTYAEPQRGVLLKIDAERQTQVRVQTEQGGFQFRCSDLTAGRPTAFLSGRVQVEPLGDEQIVLPTTTDDDFASIAVDSEGQRFVAWLAFDLEQQTDHLLLRNLDDPQDRGETVLRGRECASPQLTFDAQDRPRIVYAAPNASGNWDLYLASRGTEGWTSDRLTSAAGTDFQPAVAQGADGSLWVVWQSFRDGNANVFAKRFHHESWSEDIRVTRHPANDWQPAVSIDARGRAWVAYDTYRRGNYDVELRSVNFASGRGQVGDAVVVSQSPDFEAHASVLAEADRVWVAYDAAGPNWGKDFWNNQTLKGGTYAEPLHASRRLELRCVVDGRVLQPAHPLPQQLPPERIHLIERQASKGVVKRFYEYPQLARDGAGRIWLLFRMCRQGYSPHPPGGVSWTVYATTHTERGWLEPIELPISSGRQNQRVAWSVGRDKRLICAWAEGNRFATVDRKYAVRSGSLPTILEPAAEIACEAIAPDTPPVTERERRPDWSLDHRGQSYRLLFGDLHRHTNISRCAPTLDGCLTDAHRYALDAVGYDFLCVTDHARDVDPFSWWRTQKACDMFHVPGRYVPIYGYERSNLTPGGGHRNVFLLQRTPRVDRSDHYYVGRDLPRQDANPDTTLYPWMKRDGGALTAAHTPVWAGGTGRGTWTYHDPQVEPVAEIYQAFRQSYERPGKGVSDEASMWYALRRGHRLGFIASSDHIATHTSYACVWATENSRAAIFEALAARRTFAATDRIRLEFRAGSALMGEELESSGDRLTLRVRAECTAPVTELQIIRSGRVLTRMKPEGDRFDVEYVDTRPVGGRSYYYVRLVQDNGAMAWSSPIWVHR